MRGEIIHQIYVADGFDDDCDALIQRCIRSEKLNYETFCEIWKDMKFDSLYVGRTSAVEIAELSEELIHTAKHFMMAKVNNFEETVAALFLIYGLVNLQPYPGFAVLRLVPEDVPTIKRIEMMARRERRHDVLYILGAVLMKHTQCHAELRERGMEQVFRKYLDGYIGIDRSGFRPRGVFYRQTEELDLIREIAALTDRYENTKHAIGGQSDPSLSFINKALPKELDSSLRKIIGGIPGLDEDDDIDEADVHYSNVQAIKERAMRNAVGSMKHLTSAAERTPEKKESPIVSEIKSNPGKIKTSSPTKTFLSPKKGGKAKSPSSKPRSPRSKPKSPRCNPKNLSPNKSPGKAKRNKSPFKVASKSRKTPVAKASTSKPPLKRKMQTPKKKSKKVKTFVSESSSDTDANINLSELEKDESDSDNGNSGDELDVSAFNKPTETQMVEIEIDQLPTHMTTEDSGMVYEIEIIDKFDKAKANTNESMNDLDANNDYEEASSSKETLKTLRTKKPNRSLSRMGILPMSNFPNKPTTGKITKQLRSSRRSDKSKE